MNQLVLVLLVVLICACDGFNRESMTATERSFANPRPYPRPWSSSAQRDVTTTCQQRCSGAGSSAGIGTGQMINIERCCGQRNDRPRIVGGQHANVNAYPWLARLIYHKSFGCGGSLINDRYVVSAAHCVKGFMWFMFRVVFGEHNRCDVSNRPETRYVMKIIAHNFTISELSNDIALLLLSAPITYSHVVKPICLPKNDAQTYTGVTATVAGWGATAETGSWSCTLLEVQLPILSNQDCQNTNYNASKIKDVMMCAGYPETAHKDACTGDSGGPMITVNENQDYDLIGIVSWGYGCARKGYPGVFTRVTKYLDWIKDNTPNACYCKPY